MSSGPLNAHLTSVSLVSGDVSDLRFAMVSPPRLAFEPGQFVTLAVGTDTAGQPIRRSYSLANLTRRGDELRLLIKLLPDGAASDFFGRLAPGAEVHLTGPHGFFTLDAAHAGDVVFAVTGTGLAPVLPMLDELAERPATGRRLLFWGLRSEADIFIREELEALCARAGTELRLHLSQPGPAWQGGHGRIVQPVLQALPTLEAPTFYMVGNGAMIRELKQSLIDLGVNRKKQIRTEAFFD